MVAFAADWGRIFPEGTPVGLAVSGGPDSLALLLLAHAVLPAQGFAVATVDHGLRAESAGEAAMVAHLCAERGIAHDTLRISLASGSAIQERARAARYRALEDWRVGRGLAALVTAHHADDQAETLVMRLNRGAGLRGLAAMRARVPVPGGEGVLLRPLLGWARADLAALLGDRGIAAVDDPSNRDVRFERVRVRMGLGGADWIDPAGLAQAADHLAEADAALEWVADRLAAGFGGDEGEIALPDEVLPRTLTLRLLERVIARLGGKTPRGRDMARWHDRLAQGEVATLAGIRGDGRTRPWRFTKAPPHRAG